jgi:hypothetical protein
MATTTNYSWTTPDDTALVKDGAAAIRSLGTAIDTTVFTNAGAAVAKATVDAKGDLIAGTADNTVARLAVGTNGQVLTADSTAATGLAYTTISSSAMVLTKAQSFTTSSTINVNDCFSTTYKNYLLLINCTAVSTDFDMQFRLRVSNADNSTSNYRHYGAFFTATTTNPTGSSSDSQWEIGNGIGVPFFALWIHSPFESAITGFEALNSSNSRYRIKGGIFNATTSFTGFSLLPDSSANITGTLRVYGLVDA